MDKAIFRKIFFFFQAEDGIRDLTVTGVQTCALPIYHGADLGLHRAVDLMHLVVANQIPDGRGRHHDLERADASLEIGRASCRERVECSVVAVFVKKRKLTIEMLREE